MPDRRPPAVAKVLTKVVKKRIIPPELLYADKKDVRK